MSSRELEITDIEELNEIAEWLITTYKFEYLRYDDEGNWLEHEDLLERMSNKENDQEAYYFRFSDNEELMQISFVEAVNMPLVEIKEKYLKKYLPKLRAILRKDSNCQGLRPADSISDEYLDNLLALRWKENLKLWTIRWDDSINEMGDE